MDEQDSQATGNSEIAGEADKIEENLDTLDTIDKTNEAVAKDKDLKQDTLENYTGKHTIQLGSYRTVDEAKKFASGFKVRGYNPIIYEVNLGEKGVWYRVNLGVFDSVVEAKEYIEKENSLFKGTDHVIGVF